MDRIDSGDFHVFTFKQGLLSPLAHDLRLSLRRFIIEIEGDDVKGKFWPATLRVDGVMKKGRCDPDGLKDHHKREIQGNITRKILMTDRHPQAVFEGKREEGAQGAWRVSGTLEIKGKRAPLSLDVVTENGRLKANVELVQTKWGIKPFKAVGGTIKIKDALRIEFELEP